MLGAFAVECGYNFACQSAVATPTLEAGMDTLVSWGRNAVKHLRAPDACTRRMHQMHVNACKRASPTGLLHSERNQRETGKQRKGKTAQNFLRFSRSARLAFKLIIGKTYMIAMTPPSPMNPHCNSSDLRLELPALKGSTNSRCMAFRITARNPFVMNGPGSMQTNRRPTYTIIFKAAQPFRRRGQVVTHEQPFPRTTAGLVTAYMRAGYSCITSACRRRCEAV
eukprot:6101086-Pleurochrysis_carterae.AAC.2